MSTIAEKAAANPEAVRTQKPLIHTITNFVVMSFTANTLLAMGASPPKGLEVSWWPCRMRSIQSLPMNYSGAGQ